MHGQQRDKITPMDFMGTESPRSTKHFAQAMASYYRIPEVPANMHGQGGVALWPDPRDANSHSQIESRKPCRHLRAAKLAEDGWDVELIRKDQPLAHLNPFELRATLRQRVLKLLFCICFHEAFQGPRGKARPKAKTSLAIIRV